MGMSLPSLIQRNKCNMEDAARDQRCVTVFEVSVSLDANLFPPFMDRNAQAFIPANAKVPKDFIVIHRGTRRREEASDAMQAASFIILRPQVEGDRGPSPSKSKLDVDLATPSFSTNLSKRCLSSPLIRSIPRPSASSAWPPLQAPTETPVSILRVGKKGEDENTHRQTCSSSRSGASR
jgi:hypothetical protein